MADFQELEPILVSIIRSIVLLPPEKIERKRRRDRSDSVQVFMEEDEQRQPKSSPSPPFDCGVYSDYAKYFAYLPLTRIPSATHRPPPDNVSKRVRLSSTSIHESSEKPLIADLEQYIRDAYWGYRTPLSTSNPLFNRGSGRFRPQLDRRRINRIIFYRGCFNPPHVAHQALVHRAFSCTRDINVIAAIVYLMSDESVQSKKYASDISFTRAERVQLWTGNQKPHDWLYVYDRSSRECDEFKQRLVNATRKDGFHLEFVALYGADHLDPVDDSWDPKNMIYSDAGRAADFLNEDGSAPRLNTYEDWEPVIIDEGLIGRISAITAKWIMRSRSLELGEIIGREVHKALIEEVSAEYTDRMKGVVQCTKSGARWWVRYIPALDGPKQVSSTDVRRIITECPPDELFEKVKEMVLHPEILVQLVRRRKM
ncbi:hypothetical protein GGR53DRAFT_51852 [Hypoxylon sp. FL1150]|nr:hypothetical protein GGR53DRAFT_51852 [Hypoxylon sp. FL1150]